MLKFAQIVSEFLKIIAISLFVIIVFSGIAIFVISKNHKINFNVNSIEYVFDCKQVAVPWFSRNKIPSADVEFIADDPVRTTVTDFAQYNCRTFMKPYVIIYGINGYDEDIIDVKIIVNGSILSSSQIRVGDFKQKKNEDNNYVVKLGYIN